MTLTYHCDGPACEQAVNNALPRTMFGWHIVDMSGWVYHYCCRDCMRRGLQGVLVTETTAPGDAGPRYVALGPDRRATVTGKFPPDLLDTLEART